MLAAALTGAFYNELVTFPEPKRSLTEAEHGTDGGQCPATDGAAGSARSGSLVPPAGFVTSPTSPSSRPATCWSATPSSPTWTHLVPLACAVVERRGGMLIHGVIIARELGLPCVNGIPGLLDRIRNGDQLTVDGYLGIVTVGEPELDLELKR